MMVILHLRDKQFITLNEHELDSVCYTRIRQLGRRCCYLPAPRRRGLKKGTFLTYRGDKSRCIYKNRKKIPRPKTPFITFF